MGCLATHRFNALPPPGGTCLPCNVQHMSMSNALVLFMKAPRPGTVKTRLTARVSPGAAAALYRAFILDTLHIAQGIASASLYVAWAPEDGLADLRSALGDPDVIWTGQRGGHLGERLSNAFAEFLQNEWDKTVVLGGDSPLLPRAYVEEAFESLDRHDVVLGPAEDGGYYLIGMRRGVKVACRCARLFDSIHWGTGRVLRQTRAAIRASGLTCHELPVWHDVDRPADLDRVAREIRALRAGGDPSTGRCTESALATVGRGGIPA